MTAIRPTDSALRDKIASDEYNDILNKQMLNTQRWINT